MTKLSVENIEFKILLDAINLKYGYDFRTYSKAYLKRRIQKKMSEKKLPNISAVIHCILTDITFFNELLTEFFISVTEMFRDIDFYTAIRQKVLPKMSEKKFFRIWHAGCSSGEEVYSTAIILKELNLYNKVQIYATDLNEIILQKAKDGIYKQEQIKNYNENYLKSGGKLDFKEYFLQDNDNLIIKSGLKKNIFFSKHNLISDYSFNEMDIIFCRNVMIYFEKELQKRVFKLFYDSLPVNGILCLGSKENLLFSGIDEFFEKLIPGQKIYRKIK